MRRERGFSLVELLIVMVVLGVLATIAIPKFTSMREKSFVAAVTSDIKNVASQQEVYHSNHQVYASDVADLTEMNLSDRVIVTINEASGTGWAATAYHEALDTRPCGIFYGGAQAANAVPATVAGVVACTP